MKVSDIPISLLNPGIRVSSFKDPAKQGTLVETEEKDADLFLSFQWDWERQPTFFCRASTCDLEVVKVFTIKEEDCNLDVVNCWWEGDNFIVHDFHNRLYTYHKAWFSKKEEADPFVVESENIRVVENCQFNYVPVERPDQ